MFSSFSSFSSSPSNAELPNRILSRDRFGECWSSKVVEKGPSGLSIKAGQLLVSSMDG